MLGVSSEQSSKGGIEEKTSRNNSAMAGFPVERWSREEDRGERLREDRRDGFRTKGPRGIDYFRGGLFGGQISDQISEDE